MYINEGKSALLGTSTLTTEVSNPAVGGRPQSLKVKTERKLKSLYMCVLKKTKPIGKRECISARQQKSWKID